MQEIKHSPSPCYVVRSASDNKGKPSFYYLAVENDLYAQSIANYYFNELLGNDAKADAEFTCLARNSHYELLEALKKAYDAIDEYQTYEHDGDPWTEDARAMGEMTLDDMQRDGSMEKIKAAIAKAEGK